MNIHTEVHQTADHHPQLAVVLVHGANDHCGRYSHVIEALTASGFPVVTGDLPGHGRTEGLLGHIDSFAEYLDCIETWLQAAERLTDQGRVALVGHSMGGLIVARYLQERALRHQQLVGAAVSSPCLRLRLKVPKWKQKLADLLNRMTPRLQMASGIAPHAVSRSQAVVAAYATDPLCPNKVSVRWYQELEQAMEEARTNAGRIEVPMLVMQAGEDLLVDANETETWYHNLQPIEGNRLVCYPEFYHELFNEPEQQQVIETLLHWLEERVTKRRE